MTTRAELIDDIVEAGGDREHLESLDEESFRLFLKIALHRADPHRYPHPGYSRAVG